MCSAVPRNLCSAVPRNLCSGVPRNLCSDFRAHKEPGYPRCRHTHATAACNIKRACQRFRGTCNASAEHQNMCSAVPRNLCSAVPRNLCSACSAEPLFRFRSQATHGVATHMQRLRATSSEPANASAEHATPPRNIKTCVQRFRGTSAQRFRGTSVLVFRGTSVQIFAHTRSQATHGVATHMQRLRATSSEPANASAEHATPPRNIKTCVQRFRGTSAQRFRGTSVLVFRGTSVQIFAHTRSQATHGVATHMQRLRATSSEPANASAEHATPPRNIKTCVQRFRGTSAQRFRGTSVLVFRGTSVQIFAHTRSQATHGVATHMQRLRATSSEPANASAEHATPPRNIKTCVQRFRGTSAQRFRGTSVLVFRGTSVQIFAHTRSQATHGVATHMQRLRATSSEPANASAEHATPPRNIKTCVQRFRGTSAQRFRGTSVLVFRGTSVQI